jgi:hypothetical protein
VAMPVSKPKRKVPMAANMLMPKVYQIEPAILTRLRVLNALKNEARDSREKLHRR